MEKELADALQEFHQKLLKPEFDSLKGELADRDGRLTEIGDRLQDLSKILGQLEDALSASGLDGSAAEKEIDPELKAVIEGNP